MNKSTIVDFITPETLMRWIKASDTIIVDVREPHEYDLVRINDSISLPLSTFDPDEIPPTEGKKLVIHCASGVRCGIASKHVISSGFAGPIFRLAGGIKAWQLAGGKTVQN